MLKKHYLDGPIIGALTALALAISQCALIGLTRNYSDAWVIFSIILIAVGFIRGLVFKRIMEDAYRDQLTNLYNRGYFYYIVTDIMSRLKKTKNPMCLAMIDIDNFKSINDIHGHNEGDKALKTIANLIKHNTRKTDSVIRWGGDEFTIILPNTSTSEAVNIANRIRLSVEHRFCTGDKCTNITVSIGIVSINSNHKIDKIVDIADKAMYQAKKNKNCICDVIYK